MEGTPTGVEEEVAVPLGNLPANLESMPALVSGFESYCTSSLQWNGDTLKIYLARINTKIFDRAIKIKSLEVARSSETLVPILTKILGITTDKALVFHAVSILFNVVVLKMGNGRVPAFKKAVESRLTDVIFKKIMEVSEINQENASIVVHEVLILEELALKDTLFVNKAIACGAVKTIHTFVKNYFALSLRLMKPLSSLMIHFAASDKAVALLVGDNVVLTFQTLFFGLGFKVNNKTKRLLACISAFSKHPIFCSKMISSSIPASCLKVFSRWHKYDSVASVGSMKSILFILQNMVGMENGIELLRTLAAEPILLKACAKMPKNRQFDRYVAKIAGILMGIQGKTELPIEKFDCPLTYDLPVEKISEDSDGDSDDSDGECSVKDEFGSETSLQTQKPRQKVLQEPIFPAQIFNDDELSLHNIFWKEMDCDKRRFLSDANPSKITDLYYKGLLNNCGVINNFPTKAFDFKSAYIEINCRVKNVLPFIKVAYPDMINVDVSKTFEPLAVRSKRKFRKKVLGIVKLNSKKKSVPSVVVYDLDTAIQASSSRLHVSTNNDLFRLGLKEYSHNQLKFESRFESGNLRKAVFIGNNTYDLILNPDVNSTKHLNWFYFEVSNMTANIGYTFNIINCEKHKSQFSYGMKPVMFSVREASFGKPKWTRVGTDIFYYKNSYYKPLNKNDTKRKTYYTATFTIKFPYSLDVCYLAYHYPYTYTHLMTKIWQWKISVSPSIFRIERLCCTLNGNEVPVITITSPECLTNPIVSRRVVILTGRVHPGESNASWVMQGVIDSLLSDEQEELRNKYVFKIIPMLNIEGVVNGCSRCSLTDEDLNRRWSAPNPILHPSIYHTKALIYYCKNRIFKDVFMYCDFHGHTMRKNVFLFGCTTSQHWKSLPHAEPKESDDPMTKEKEEDPDMEVVSRLPKVMKECCSIFSLNSCKYSVTKIREATARVTVWREMGVQRSYTMEASFCGSDTGPNKGYHFSANHLLGVGKSFCTALALIDQEPVSSVDDEEGENCESINCTPYTPCSVINPQKSCFICHVGQKVNKVPMA